MPLNSYGKQQEAIRRQSEALQKEWTDKSPYKVGDKVIYHDRNGVPAAQMFVFKINLASFGNEVYFYDLSFPKTDGSMPKKIKGGFYWVPASQIKRVNEVHKNGIRR